MLNYKGLEKSNDLTVGHRVLLSVSNNEENMLNKA
jgi:hypothetical protein